MNGIQPTRNRQAGLSIIELMIALLLGSLLTVGLVQIFTSNSQAFQMAEAVARTQEYGRIATEMLSREVRGAGYYGCGSDNVANNLDIDETDSDWDFFDFVGAAPISSANEWRPGDALGNTDILHVSGLDGAGMELATTAPPTAASIKVSSRSGESLDGYFQNDDVIAISDCQGTDIVQISNVSGNSGSTEITLVANDNQGNSMSPGNNYDDNDCSNTGNSGAGTNCLASDYEEGAKILKPFKRTYYVGTSSTTAQPALRMVEYTRTSSSTFDVVEGVIDMQVRYGLSGEADQPVSNWKDAESVTAAELEQVRAARVSLLVRGGPDNLFDEKAKVCFPAWSDCSVDDNYTATDNRMYRVYSFTTNVRNRSK